MLHSMLTKFAILAAVCLLGLGASHSGAANATTYTLTELTPLAGDTDSTAYGLNSLGQAVGTSYPTVGSQAVIWNSGSTPTALNPLPGGATSAALGVNDAGQVVGYSLTTGAVTAHAAIWNGTTPTDLGAVYADGINNIGQVVGTNADNHAVVWNGTTPTDLGTLGGPTSYATSINNLGQVAGTASTTADLARGVVWNGTTPTILDPLSGDAVSYANGINNSGQVVGESIHTVGNGGSQAVVWNGGTPTALSTLGGLSGVANGINDSGLVVGWSDAVGGPGSNITESHATRWEPDGTPIDLNSVLNSTGTGWLLIDATAINDIGQIVGYGVEINDPQNSLAFLLTPTATVPEPSTWAMTLLGFAGLGYAGYCRARAGRATRAA